MAEHTTSPWRASLDEALQEAGRSGKPVLVDFFSAT